MCLSFIGLLEGRGYRSALERLPRMQKALGLPLSTEKANAFVKFLSTRAIGWAVYFNHFATLTSCFGLVSGQFMKDRLRAAPHSWQWFKSVLYHS